MPAEKNCRERTSLQNLLKDLSNKVKGKGKEGWKPFYPASVIVLG